jgi:F0F1-type ATP synthase assembly protein I
LEDLIMANNTGTKQRDEERGGSSSQSAADLKNKARDAASNVAGQVRETAANVADKARDVASNVAGQARDMASNLGERASEATGNLGSGMQSLAGTIRERMPQEGMMGQAASSVAGALESSGRYLQEEGLGGIGRDVSTIIRRNPIPAVLIGVGIGYLIARATRS